MEAGSARTLRNGCGSCFVFTNINKLLVAELIRDYAAKKPFLLETGMGLANNSVTVVLSCLASLSAVPLHGSSTNVHTWSMKGK